MPHLGPHALREFSGRFLAASAAAASAFLQRYAYCRWADDLGDEVGDASRACELLAWWRKNSRRVTAARRRIRCLSRWVQQSKNSPSLASHSRTCFRLSSRTSMFANTNHLTRYETIAAAAPTRWSDRPLFVRIVFGPNAAWSDSICTGLQLANFWQDVARDFDIGRVYLPRESRLRFGYSDDDLANRVTNTPFVELMGSKWTALGASSRRDGRSSTLCRGGCGWISIFSCAAGCELWNASSESDTVSGNRGRWLRNSTSLAWCLVRSCVVRGYGWPHPKRSSRTPYDGSSLSIAPGGAAEYCACRNDQRQRCRNR